MPRICFYGDDFTGSVDALLQYRRAGLSGVLVTSIEGLRDALRQAQGAESGPAQGAESGPALGADSGPDVVAIAGIARSLATNAMADQVRPALEQLRSLRPAVVQYKACSTADSSPEIGSLGRVIEIGREVFGDATVPVAFAQPDFGRYTAFGHHFARDGDHVYRLDRQPTMRQHPVTPATDSDLQAQLSGQTRLPIGSLHWVDYGDAEQLRALINTSTDAAVVCDALTNDHLTLLGQAILDDADRTGREPRFVLGSGGLSLGLGRALVSGPVTVDTDTVTRAAGPTVVVNGSTSPRTREQIDHAMHHGWVEVDALTTDLGEITSRLPDTSAPMIITSHRRTSAPDPDMLTARLAAVADACLRQDPRARIVVSGGDTSGRVVTRLGLQTITITHQPWDNVALCRGVGAAPHLQRVEVALKGGQMGHTSLFEDIRHGRPLVQARG